MAGSRRELVAIEAIFARETAPDEMVTGIELVPEPVTSVVRVIVERETTPELSERSNPAPGVGKSYCPTSLHRQIIFIISRSNS